MNTYLISYDLGLPETQASYAQLTAYIKSFSHWAKPLQSVWFVKTTKTAGQIRDEIKTSLDSNDKVIVIKVTPGWGTYAISKQVTDWMHKNI